VKLVVDAAVAVKWFVPETHSAEASRLLHPQHELLAPDLLFPEVGNVLWKKVERRELQPEEARSVLHGLARVSLAVHPCQPLVPAALEIALANRRTVYDSLYLALAEARGCRLVTADRRLFNALSAGRLGRSLLWVADLPTGKHGA